MSGTAALPLPHLTRGTTAATHRHSPGPGRLSSKTVACPAKAATTSLQLRRRRGSTPGNQSRRSRLSVRAAASGAASSGLPPPSPGDGPGDGEVPGVSSSRGNGPALSTLASIVRDTLLMRVKSVRRYLFLKLLVLLVGFFFANALSTVVGQTGDWDVLVAGFLVAVVESVGLVVHKLPKTEFWKRLPEGAADVLACVNYFKCGLIFGLFVDCFKVGS